MHKQVTEMPPLSDPMYPMDTQAVIDRVYEHFVVQGHPRCVDADGDCVYRDETGNGCALGCCLPSDTPDKVLDFAGDVYQLFNDHQSFVRRVFVVDTSDHLNALFEIQRSHDDAAMSREGINEPEPFNIRFEQRLREIAVRRNCVFPGDK